MTPNPFVWKAGVAGKYKRIIEPWLEEHRHLVPTWCERVALTVKKKADTLAASIEVDPEYRQAKIYFHPGFWQMDAEMQELTLVHELLHISTWSLACLCEKLAGLVKERKARALILGQVKQAEEAAVEDLSRSIVRAKKNREIAGKGGTIGGIRGNIETLHQSASSTRPNEAP
jgi:hypothetical protein